MDSQTRDILKCCETVMVNTSSEFQVAINLEMFHDSMSIVLADTVDGGEDYGLVFALFAR